MNQHPPRPRLALAVGIIGHRPNRLPSEQTKLDAIAAEIATVLDAVARETAAAHSAYHEYFSGEPAIIAVISSLAEGADRMTAHAAIARSAAASRLQHEAVEIALDVPLPFAAEIYKDDFKTEAAKAEFDDLLKKARSVLVLPGGRGDPGVSERDRALQENRSYEAAGLTLLNQSDIILAVWDGGPSAGRGGTPEMLDIAARSGTPIIHIDAKGELATRICWDGLTAFPIASNAVADLPAASLGDALPRLIDELVRPPEQGAVKHPLDKKPDSPGKAPEPQATLERARLKRYYRKGPSPVNPGLAFPLLMAFLGVRPLRRTDLWPDRPDALSAQLAGFDQSKPPSAQLRHDSVLAAAFGWADACGVWLAQVFRSAFVMNFSLAALAVVAAAASLVASDISKMDARVLAAELAHHKLPFVILELIFIFLVLGVTVAGYWSGWHHRWLESREVAERLRAAFPLWTLGLRPATFPAEEPTWTGWYARAIVRAQGMRPAILDAAGLQRDRDTLRAVFLDQCNYHRTTAVRMAKLERRLEVLGSVLFVFTLLALIAFFIAVLAGVGVPPRITYSVTGIAAGLPALGTAMFGIRVIGDFDGIARRSERTCEVLQKIIEATDAETAPNLTTLRTRARAASDVMLGDVASWRLAAESRTLAIPS